MDPTHPSSPTGGIARPKVEGIFDHVLTEARVTIKPNASPTTVGLRGWKQVTLTVKDYDFHALSSEDASPVVTLTGNVNFRTRGVNQPQDVTSGGFALMNIHGGGATYLLAFNRDELVRFQRTLGA